LSTSATAALPSELETRLSAYLDGESPEDARHEIEALLVNDPNARSVHDSLKRGADAGRRMFDEMLREPVPLDMVRTIKNTAPPRKAVRLPDAPHRRLQLRPTLGQAAAGAALFFVIGGALGYVTGTYPSVPDMPQVPATATDARDWLDDIVSSYRLYTRHREHPVEMAADRPADILDWLTTNTGIGFRIPDLSQSGLTFLGARLVSTQGRPTGMLFYKRTDGEGDIIAISFVKSRPDTSRPVEDIRADTGLVTWSTPLATYVIVGPSAAADLDDIAGKAAGLI
jgi:anti-sigma factor RsiW